MCCIRVPRGLVETRVVINVAIWHAIVTLEANHFKTVFDRTIDLDLVRGYRSTK